MVTIGLVICACSSESDSDEDCAALERMIRSEAISRGHDGDRDGTPDAKGVCSSPDPDVQKSFGEACARLKACSRS